MVCLWLSGFISLRKFPEGLFEAGLRPSCNKAKMTCYLIPLYSCKLVVPSVLKLL